MYFILRNGRNKKPCDWLKEGNDKTRMTFCKEPNGCRTSNGIAGTKAGSRVPFEKLLPVLGSKQGLEGDDLGQSNDNAMWRPDILPQFSCFDEYFMYTV